MNCLNISTGAYINMDGRIGILTTGKLSAFVSFLKYSNVWHWSKELFLSVSVSQTSGNVNLVALGTATCVLSMIFFLLLNVDAVHFRVFWGLPSKY